MSDIVLQLVWVAAHHGLRARGAALFSDRLRGDQNFHVSVRNYQLWEMVQDIGAELGSPPAPGPHEARA